MGIRYTLQTTGALVPRFPEVTSKLTLADLTGISKQLGKEEDGEQLDKFAEIARDCVCISTGDKIHALSLDQFRAMLMQGSAIVHTIEQRIARRLPQEDTSCLE